MPVRTCSMRTMGSLLVEKLPPCEGRTLIIGDIHGCLREFSLLVEQFNPQPEDRILTVGDLFNRGPESIKTIKLAQSLGVRSVMGNHEKRFLKAWKSGDVSSLSGRDRETFKKLKPKHLEWIATWPHVFKIPSLNALVVHGGFVPGRKWRKQHPSDVTYIQVVDRKGRPAKRSHDPQARPWADFWEGKRHVFYGHTPREEPLLHARATGLDTGCVYGYQLSAVSLPDFTLYKVPAQRAYIGD